MQGLGRGGKAQQGRAVGTPQAHVVLKNISVWPWVLTPAAVLCGIPVEAGLALGTVRPCRVVQAAQAVPRAPVARLWVGHVNVVVALAGQAAPARLLRVPVVPRSTLVTAGTCRYTVPKPACTHWHRAWGSARGLPWHLPVYPGLQWQMTCRDRLS